MPRGPFGLPRPFATEINILTISLLHTEQINPASISAANGVVVPTNGDQEIKPFFDVIEVSYNTVPNPGISNRPEQLVSSDVRVDVDDDWIDLSEIKVFHTNIDEFIDVKRTPDETILLPSASVNRMLAEVSGEQKIIYRVDVPKRLSEQELQNNIMDFIQQPGPFGEFLEMRDAESEFVAYILGDGTSLTDASTFERDLAGPDNKSVSNLSITTISVEE